MARLQIRRLVLAITLAVCLHVSWSKANASDIRIYAAASLTSVLEAISRKGIELGLPACACVHAATSVLARQIERGAPADIFISANPQWMTYLWNKQKLRSEPRFFAGNRLVLIAPADRMLSYSFASGQALAEVMGEGWLALADPDHVPAGIYAMSSLKFLNQWSGLSRRVARAANARAALALVVRKEARAGIVYETDMLGEKRVNAVDFLPAGSYPDIRYMVAALNQADAPDIGEYLEFLTSPSVTSILTEFGFRPSK
jgi:molybdate transport system substrate-binding protein